MGMEKLVLYFLFLFLTFYKCGCCSRLNAFRLILWDLKVNSNVKPSMTLKILELMTIG